VVADLDQPGKACTAALRLYLGTNAPSCAQDFGATTSDVRAHIGNRRLEPLIGQRTQIARLLGQVLVDAL
jgi:hypothetical protein